MNNGHTSSAGTQGADPARRPVAPGRRQRRAEETRLRLFRSAIQLFAERGFPNVTIGDITEAADVGKGTFFNYFESKDHVLGVMADIQLSKIREYVRLAADGSHTIQSVLHQLALRLVEEPGRSPELARAVVSSFLASDVVRGIIEDQLAEGRRMIAQMVAQGQKVGMKGEPAEIDPRLKKKTVAIQYQQAVMGTILLWSLYGEPPLANWIEDSFQHFWRAIAANRQEQQS
jgi:AcrR family transcriptional regulator